MPVLFESARSLQDAVGRDLGFTEWMILSQERIQMFAQATEDHQWIHVDPERAAAGPFGACIAHGFLTLSLLAHFLPQLLQCRNLRMGLNYGCDRVRFPAAVRAGSRIRASAVIMDAEPHADKGLQVRVRVTVHVEGQERPGCVADSLSRFYFND